MKMKKVKMFSKEFINNLEALASEVNKREMLEAIFLIEDADFFRARFSDFITRELKNKLERKLISLKKKNASRKLIKSYENKAKIAFSLYNEMLSARRLFLAFNNQASFKRV